MYSGLCKQYLYKLTFPNDMVYIGVAGEVKSRWANNGIHYRQQNVYRYIKEFGWDNIKKEVLLFMPKPEGDKWYDNERALLKLEKELIHAYGDRCYNQQGKSEFHKEIAIRNRENGVYNPRVYWDLDGESKPAKQWCDELGVSYPNITRRMQKYGLTLKEALDLPEVPRIFRRDPVKYWVEQGFGYLFEKSRRA